MIRDIIMENIKGQTCMQRLTGRDIFIGPNGAGKTTRLQAIGISLLGYVPGEGKTAADTFKLSTGNEMSAGIHLDDFQFTRSFVRSEKEEKKTGLNTVSIKQKIGVYPSKGESNTTQCEARIYEEVGNFPVMLDFKDFLDLSDPKRREFFYHLSPIKLNTWDKIRICEYLSDKLLTPELEENNPEKYNAVRTTIIEALKAYPEKFDTQAGLTAMTKYVSDQLTYWKKRKEEAAGAVKKLAEMKSQLADTDRGIAQNKKSLEEQQTKLNSLTRDIARDTEKKKAIEKQEKIIADLQAEIDDWENRHNTDNLKELQTQLAELQKKIIQEKDYEQIRNDIAVEIESLNARINGIKNEAEGIRNDLTEATTKVQLIDNALFDIHKIQSGNVEGVATCGRCIINPDIVCTNNFEGFEKSSETQKKDLKKIIEDADNKLGLLKTKYDGCVNKIDELEKKKDQTYKDERSDLNFNNDIKSKISTLESKIQYAESFDILKAETLKKKQKALVEAKSQPMDPIGDLSMMEQQKSGIEKQISELKAKITSQEEAKTTIANMQQSMLDDKKAGYFADSYKLVSDAIGPKGIQGEIVKSILAPIQQDIQDKIQKLGQDEIFYFETESDTGKEIFQFGWINETTGMKRNFDALSDGEKLLLLACLIITIIERSNPKLKVLAIDGMQELDKFNFQKCIKGLNAIGKNIDNIVLCGVGIAGIELEKFGTFEGFKVWELFGKG